LAQAGAKVIVVVGDRARAAFESVVATTLSVGRLVTMQGIHGPQTVIAVPHPGRFGVSRIDRVLTRDDMDHVRSLLL
jgi:hypothetical protein